MIPLPEPAGFSAGDHDCALFTKRRGTGRNFAKGSGTKLFEWYTADQLRAHEAAVRAELLAIAKRRADHEASAAAHHSGSWYEAHQHHLSAHKAMRDLIDAVWPTSTPRP